MLIQIDDAVVKKYLPEADRAKIPVEKLLARVLTKFADIPVNQRVVGLTGEHLEEVERLLGLGSTQNATTLMAAIRAWAGITLGDIRLDFSPAQLEELALRAEKQGKPTKDLVEDLVQQICRDLFYGPVALR